MKTKLILAFTFLVSLTFYSQSVVTIPDSNFEQALIDLGIDSNGLNGNILESDAEATTGYLNVAGLGITDVTGLEAFVNITGLDVHNNNLTTLDVSSNVKLKYLYAFNNQITSLSVSNLPDLEQFMFSGNQTSSIDVTSNVKLKIFEMDGNGLTSLDLSQNTLLEYIFIGNNPLIGDFDTSIYSNLKILGIDGIGSSIIDVTNAPELEMLFATSNNFTSIDLSNNPKISRLYLNGNPNLKNINVTNLSLLQEFGADNIGISELDVTNNLELVILQVGANYLTSLDVSNNTKLERLHAFYNLFTAFDISNNLQLKDLDINNLRLNGALDLSKHSSLERVVLNNTLFHNINLKNGNNTALTDVQIKWNTNLACVQVDDVAFATTNWTNIDDASVFSLACSEPVVNIPDVNMKAALVADTVINSNGDDEIQFSEAAAATGTVNVGGLGIADVTGLEAFVNITGLDVRNNSISEIDVSELPKLEVLVTEGTALNSIDLSNNTNLKTYFGSNITGNLREIDFSNNSLLEVVHVNGNNLLTLNIKNGANNLLTDFSATNNPDLTCIQVDDVAFAETKFSEGSWKKEGATYNTVCIAPVVNIPDVNMKAAFVANTAINRNGDDEIQVTEAEAVTGFVNVTGLGISDVTGLEAFINITGLDVHNNNLTTLDVSSNVKLKYLYAFNNQITSLSVSNLPDLEQFMFSGNQTSSIDVTSNVKLKRFEMDGNGLTSLDLSQNTLLEFIFIGNNPLIGDFDTSIYPNLKGLGIDNIGSSIIDVTNAPELEMLFATKNNFTSIDLSNNPKLTKLWLSENPNINNINITNLSLLQEFGAYSIGISELDVTNNLELVILQVGANSLTSLDVSNNSKLERLFVFYNLLTGFDISNNLQLKELDINNLRLNGTLDLSKHSFLERVVLNNTLFHNINLKNGNNTALTDVQIKWNTNLACVQVDDVAFATTNWTNIDDASVFSTACAEIIVNIPDANLKAALVADTAINTNGDDEIQFSEAEAATGFLNVKGLGIADVTGLEAFVNITGLDISSNNLTSIDVSLHTKLSVLKVNGNQLTNLDISKNTNLIELHAFDNLLTSLDVSENTLLEILRIDNDHTRTPNNQIASLDVSNNLELKLLYFSNNPVATLDVSKNLKLIDISFYGTPIYELDVSKNTELKYFYAGYNWNLRKLNLKNGNNTKVEFIDLANNPNLTCVEVDDVAFSTTNWTNIEDASVFSLECYIEPVVNIPDANFKAGLLADTSINRNGDDEIQVGEAETATEFVNVAGLGIADVTGLEAFINIKYLDVSDNNLTSIDVSSNTKLLLLKVGRNQLTNLDISKNINLIEIQAFDNLLTSLDVSKNTLLESFRIENDHTRTPNNQITSLDFSNNLELKLLFFSNNPIATLDVSKNLKLENIIFYGTPIAELDLSQNTEIKHFSAGYNPALRKLNLKNGNNSNIETMHLANNANLTCVEVDDVAYSTTNWTVIENASVFNVDCYIEQIVNIPDVNMKAALVADTAINSNRDDEIQVGEAEAITGYLTGAGLGITDLTGLEAFVNITGLDVSNNDLTTLDVSSNVKLKQLFAFNNQITSLSVANLPDLEELGFSNNQISNIDVSSNVKLKRFEMEGNGLTSLDLSQNTLLEYIFIGYNPLIGDFDTSIYPNLRGLGINEIGSSIIDVTNAPELEMLFATKNNFTSIDLSNNPKISRLWLTDNSNINNIDVSNLSSLWELGLDNIGISELDVTNNLELVRLRVGSNSLTSLDVSNNSKLEYLLVYYNLLTAFDISNNLQLKELDINNLRLNGALDLSKHSSLERVVLNNTLFDNINLKNGNNTALTDVQIKDNTNLTCVQVDDVAFSTTNWTNIDDASVFGVDCYNFVNTPPLAENVQITGTLTEGEALTATYDYTDTDSDVESGSTYQWYRSDDNAGTNKIAIVNATTQLYTLTTADVDKFISFEVTPNDGKDFGTSVESDFQGPIEAFVVNTATTVNGMWSDPANWSGGIVPTSTDNVFIPSGTTLQIGADISEINSLENEGTIIINSTFSLKSKTNMVNNGTIIMNSDNEDSSVLFVVGTATGDVKYSRGGLKANLWSLVTPPVSGQNIKEFALNTDNDIRVNAAVSPGRYAIGYYDDSQEAGQKWNYYTEDLDAGLTFTSGESYALSRSTDGSVSFTGTLTTTNNVKTLKPGEWNAIGNPFTTYYPANKNGASSFINDNYDILEDEFKGLYIWNSTQNKYVVVSELDIQNRSFTPGQGFFIKVKADQNSIEFKEAKRSLKPTTGDNTFSKEVHQYIKLSANNGAHTVTTDIKFFSHATKGFDIGLDLGNFSTSSFDFYSHLVDESNTNKYAIQSINLEDKEEVIIPITVLSNKAEVQLSSLHENLGENIVLLLEDRENDVFTDITNTTSTYKISFDDAINTQKTLYLHIGYSKALSTDDSIVDKIQMYAANNTLYVQGLNDKAAAIELYNVLGQGVFKLASTKDQKINLPASLKAGVYTVKLISENKTISKKIVIK